MARWDEKSVAAELLPARPSVERPRAVHRRLAELDVEIGRPHPGRHLEKRLLEARLVVGVKLGLTSEAKQRRMGVYAPFVAWLTDDMVMSLGDPVPQEKLIHPRIEPEIVFVMKDRLEGPGVTRESAMAAVGTIAGGAEVIDSRYRNFRFRAGDVIADNASSGAYVVIDKTVTRTRSTCLLRRSRSMWRASSSTAALVRTSKVIRVRPSRWLPMTWLAVARRSKQVGSC